MTEGRATATDVRGKLALALDVDDLVAATRTARELQPYFGVAKIGLELYSAAGPDAISSLTEMGYEVFADLKLHDIPTTVRKAARVLGALGAHYVTIHAHGGVQMLRAGVEGLREGASRAELPEPIALAVTVLTSDTDAPPHIVPNRIRTAIEGGCGGIVCAASDVKDAKMLAPRLRAVVPGIRFEGSPTHDQGRAATPREAYDAGADLLVIGRAVTEASDPVGAAKQLLDELS
jgi:orotidine-5'-phosphate decarboxylase